LRHPAAPAASCLALLYCATAGALTAALSAEDAWIRATPGTDVAAAYLTLRNRGSEALVIVGVRCPSAQGAMIHETTITAGRSSMRPHERLRVGAGETVRLAPGGLHIMLHGLTRALSPGEEVPLVLLLEGGDSLAVTARVRPLSAG
jgi:periplasmic copper chaperone A